VCHGLAVVELVVELREAARLGLVSDLQLLLEPDVCRRYIGHHGRPRRLCPDLSVRLTIDDQQLIWFVEVDRSTEGLRQVAGKAQVYLDYWRSGTEQAQIGTFPKVLWSVPNQVRLDAIVRALEPLPEPAAQMFVVCTQESACQQLRSQQPNYPMERRDQ
jgi:hypothetical protein